MINHARSNQDQSPLWGAVLCWTAILPEQRSEMAAVAQQMGATHKLDLTSDVTHLIVGSIDTPKYKYVAKERQDIKVVSTSWLEAVRLSWMEGGNTDVEALEEEYRLPTFFGLQICVTGFDDAIQRQRLQDAVTNNGGTYHGDLTKQVTHLVAASASGKKYQYAGAWRIHRVSLEWIQESLDRGMALDELKYSPEDEPEKRGIGAVTGRPLPSTRLGKRQRAEEQAQEQVDAGRRKLRRTASSKLGSQSGEFWKDIGNESRVPTPRSIEPDTLDTPTYLPEDKSQPPRKQSKPVAVDHETEERQPTNTERGRWKEDFLAPGEPYSNSYIVHGFNEKRSSLLKSLMRRYGAEPVDEPWPRGHEHESADLMVWLLPHDADETSLETLQNTGDLIHPDDLWVTEIWLEKCLHSKRWIPPEEQPLYTPFNAAPIAGFEDLTICPTSFSGVDLLHFSKAVKSTGAQYNETLRRQTSVLVCNSQSHINPEKLRYALENHIPAVTQQWLWDCLRSSSTLPFDCYAVARKGVSPQTDAGQQYQQDSTNTRTTLPSTNKPAAPVRGKGPKSQRSGQLHFSVNVKREPSPEEVQKPPPKLSLSAKLTSQPLQDKSPNLSPRKASQASPPKRRQSIEEHPITSQLVALGEQESYQDGSMLSMGEENTSHVQESYQPEPVRTSSNMSTAIATLMAHKQKAAAPSRPSSASSDVNSSSIPRKHRPLGRALSGGSTGMSRHESFDVNASGHASVKRIGPFELDDEEEEASRPSNNQPSQALGYEDPESNAVRSKLMSKFGPNGAGEQEDTPGKMRRVEGIGRVTDAAHDPAEGKSRRRATRRK